LLGKIGLALVLIVGASWCIGPNASLTSGQLLAFVLLVNMLYEPIARLHSVNQMMIGGFASAKRVFSLLDNIQQEDYQKGITQKLQGNISFKQITFGYQPDRPILTNLNLEIQSKQTVAFVGATGSGKSTLFQLLLQFYQPQVGNIMIDGVPINEFNTQHLRQSIAYVSQDSFLFATSIRNNLSLGKLDATDAELWTALTQACADNFVAELPNGLDSDVGERGSQLSGGERQRICIARAFLKNAPILLLDEATSAIDNKNETLIQKALESLKQSRTCLIIAHRLSTVINADNIYVMHQGNIIASGTHQQLLANCSYYAELSRKNLEAN
jgi:ABC-type multidrug transport system fused ATPase/permease subunit